MWCCDKGPRAVPHPSPTQVVAGTVDRLGAKPVTVEESLKTCPPVQTVALSRGTLSYRSVGQGPMLVFLHGLAGNSLTWVRQFGHFSTRFHVVAWDAPGFGHSDVVEPDIDAFAGTLGELIDLLGGGPAALVGHSMGGVVATRLAGRRPELVVRLVLSCTHPGYGETADSPMQPRIAERQRELATVGPVEYGRIRARGLFPPGTPLTEAMELAARIAAEARPESIAVSTRMLQLADNRPFLPNLAMPVMVLTGGKDPVVKPAMGEALRELTPSARHVTLPGLGHAPYLEDPAVYNAALDEFLETAAVQEDPTVGGT